MKLLYPVSYMSSQMGMTALLVGLGLFGKAHLATEVGLIQGSLLAFYYTFAGNFRSLILREAKGTSTRPLVLVRLVLAAPLAVGAYIVSVYSLGDVTAEFALILTIRKIGEWLSEIHLCEAERDGARSYAWIHLAMQTLLLGMALFFLCSGWEGADDVLWAWALLPLVLSLRHLIGVLAHGKGMEVPLVLLAPHFGSSMVHGVTVYVFRVTLLLLVGTMIAGEMYTAFSIGGMIGSVFANALGPSVVLHEQRIGKRYLPPWLRAVLLGAATLGVMLAVASFLWPSGWLFKSAFFWQATGLSLVGGVVMAFAQRQRLQLLQGQTEENVFAPDVLLNILIVMIVPVVYYVVGVQWLGTLYLLNALLAMVIYRATICSEEDHARTQGRDWRLLGGVLVATIFVPVFFQFGTGVFRSTDFIYDTGGLLSRLPVPISVFACFAGIIVIGRFRRAGLALSAIFGSFALMVMSTVATSVNGTSALPKLMLLMQFLLPMFALVLGQTYGSWLSDDRQLAKVLVVLVTSIVPVQLVSTWLQGYSLLTPFLYVFSIYQHLQYVPVILAVAYLIALNVLWDAVVWRAILLWLAIPMGMYVVASSSMLATTLLISGCLAAAWYLEWRLGRGLGHMRVIVLLVISGALGYGFVLDSSMKVDPLGSATWVSKIEGLKGGRGLDNWTYYADQVVASLQSFVFGNKAPPARNVITSAHNYYLDVVYNFGVLGVVAIVTLIAVTMTRLYKERSRVMASPGVAALGMVVLFLLFPDNLFKVGMRQPYPGIATFFLWGLLLARMERRESVLNVNASVGA